MKQRRAPQPPPRITLKFLAEQLGLSKTTISIVLNNAPHAQTIAPLTRQRILDAARAYNYRPSFAGRLLHTGRSYLIGVLSPDLSEGYTSSLLAGIENALLTSEYQFFVASHHWSERRTDRTAQLFSERGVEGVILINSPFVPHIDLPSIHIGRHQAEVAGTSLLVDNHAGILMALRHLVELGHRRIAFIRGHEGSVDSEDRWLAICAAARELSLTIDPTLVTQLERVGVISLAAMEEGARCAEMLLPHRGRFTALLSFNDMSAIGAMNRFREAGWRIPDELSIVGFDDIVEARIAYPALTTVRQPLRLMGETAAQEIITQITSRAAPTAAPHTAARSTPPPAIKPATPRRTLVFQPELILRASTAPPPHP